MGKPIIGLTTYGRTERNLHSNFYDAHYVIPAAYVDAVRRAGGVPILLPPDEPAWRELLAVVDGVILIGGGDIDPDLYGGNAAHPNLSLAGAERDSFEMTLARELANGTPRPTLAICRGMQVVNVALGGSMHEHLLDILPEDEDIHGCADVEWVIQDVQVELDSRLAAALGETAVTPASSHHQAVKDIAPDLTVTAVAPDGIVEGLELPDHPWFVAVQWHPEATAVTDEVQQRLFDALVAACEKVRG